MSKWDFRSQDSDEIQEFLGETYAENEFKFYGGKGRPARTRICGTDIGEVAQYNHSYSSPFTFLSETARESFLVLTCTAGSAKFRRGNDAIEFRAGRTAPISATHESRVESGGTLAHIATHINAEAINSLCSRRLDRPLDAPVLFEHVPFTDELKVLWDLVIRSVGLLLDSERPSSIAINSLTEYAATLLLERHPHNYSRFFQARATVSAQVAREARQFIEQNTHRDITLADVAAFAGCSIHALHEGFCEHLGVTPQACLHFARRTPARSQLPGDAGESSVAEAAQSRDSVELDSYAAAHQGRYGENPTDTFQRYFRSIFRSREHSHSQSRGTLTAAKIDLLRHHINVSLGKRIFVGKLAAMVCMSPQSFAPAFKRAFKTSPAQYVLQERVKWACWLLANTNARIAAVAAETGFSSQSHLTTVLKRRTGKTPDELRKSSGS